ncbi:Uncharacterised protein [Chlamydia trachomatis]|nr:Uncharacterised protein [Chlamydia trachomatis]
MHVVIIHIVRNNRSNRARLRNLLRLKPRALQHVHKVHVSANIQLVSAIQTHSSIFKKSRHNAVRNRSSNLTFNIVANNRNACVTELLRPNWVGSNKNRKAIHKRASSFHSRSRISLVCLLGAYWQVRHKHVYMQIAQNRGNIHRFFFRFVNHLLIIVAQTIVSRSTLHFNTKIRHVCKANRVVLRSINRLA